MKPVHLFSGVDKLELFSTRFQHFDNLETPYYISSVIHVGTSIGPGRPWSLLVVASVVAKKKNYLCVLFKLVWYIGRNGRPEASVNED